VTPSKRVAKAVTPSKRVAKAVTPSKRVAKAVTPPQRVAQAVAPREVEDVHELLSLVAMAPVEFFEMSAKQSDASEKRNEKDDKPSFMLKIGHPADGIAFRFVVEITNGKGHIRVGAGVIYSTKTKEGLAPVSEVIGLEFANRVAILALVPYLREAVANLSWRVLGHAITLPMIRPGELEFSPMSDGEAVEHGL
jgi:hypothetical protein